MHKCERDDGIIVTREAHNEKGTIFYPLCCYIMVTASHIAHSHIQRVLMLTALITYFAPMLGGVEVSLRALAHLSIPSQENVTIAYEVMNTSATAINRD